MRFAIIDESGRLFDPNDKILIFAAVVTETLLKLDKILPFVKKRLPKKTKLAEIKFSTTGDKTRLKVLNEISKRNLKLFVLVVDKEGRKIKDDSENYSLLISTLLKKVLNKYPDTTHIIIDRHFTWITQRERFNASVQRKLGKLLFIEHLDSQQNTIVSLADFVAGAVRTYYVKEDPKFVEKIENLIEKQIITKWRDLRAKEKVKA